MRIPARPPDWRSTPFPRDRLTLSRTMDFATSVDGYPHWDKVRRMRMPDDLEPELVWTLIKVGRMQSRRALPLRQTNGEPFWYTLPDELLRKLEAVNTDAGGQLASPEVVTTPETRDRFIVRSLMEEAITSSQLEGASTTHRVAKEMLRTQRPARTKSEQMILNNYRGMQWVRMHVQDDITPDRILELHGILTLDTLEDPDDGGRVQRPEDERVVVGASGQDLVLHEPPRAEELPERLQSLCDFANGRTGDWMPRTLRAIICHFQMGYDHYFVDGNGRTARALFYWVALREGSWLLEFIPISRILNAAPIQYGESYLKTETDEGDVTYFALSQVSVIRRGLDDLNRYLERKIAEDARVRTALPELELNHRERALIDGFLRDPGLRVTAQSHAASHRVTDQTARSDLRHLTSLNLLREGPKRRRQESWLAGSALTDLRRRPKL